MIFFQDSLISEIPRYVQYKVLFHCTSFNGDQRAKQSILHEQFESVREEVGCCFCVLWAWRLYNVGVCPGAVGQDLGCICTPSPPQCTSEVMAHPLSELSLHNRLPFIKPQTNRAERELRSQKSPGAVAMRAYLLFGISVL